MPINVDSSTSTASIQSTAPQFGPQVSLMNANDIIAYVTMALGNIGDQLNDYKELVMKQQADAKEIREALVAARQLNANGGDFKKEVDFPAQEQNYNEAMTKLSHHLDDPNVKKAYDTMIASCGSYVDTNTGKTIGAPDEKTGKILVPANIAEVSGKPVGEAKPSKNADLSAIGQKMIEIKPDTNGQDGVMNKEEMDGFISSINDALSGLNSGNELMMMNLQNLMQVRNQISQFGSNNLKTLNDTQMGLISNMK